MIATVGNDAANPTALPPAQTQAGDDGAASKASAVDFRNFLKLLTAQLRNQDPLSPLDSTEFVAQLASFSSVEQLVSANKRLDEIAASLIGDAMERYAPWIGREAEIAGAPAHFEGGPVRFRAAPLRDATRIEAVIRDANGGLAARMPVADPGVMQQWDGAGAREGLYTIDLEYFDGGQKVRSEPASILATIEEVRLSADGAELRLSGGRVVAPEHVAGLGLAQ